MNIYIDESGSINNKLENNYFVITLIVPDQSNSIKRSCKRFISSHYDQLEKLDLKHRKMFKNGEFKELKGSCFDRYMKQDFVRFFAQRITFLFCISLPTIQNSMTHSAQTHHVHLTIF